MTEPVKASLIKSPTGITGFDDITFGGLPSGRTTLMVGGAGSGKTLFGIQFLINGITRFNESGVLMSFEENPIDLTKNVSSMGIDLQALQQQKRLAVKHVEWEGTAEAGSFDLEPLFIRLGLAIDSVNAKRVVIDGIENLFTALNSEKLLRAELQRLFHWLKDRQVTAIITGERGIQTVTRHGLEEYLSDCVIILEQRIEKQIATRLLRILKYRGSAHGPDEYPFLIDSDGLSVMPVTTISLRETEVSNERISSGVTSLDNMLSGQGYYRGSAILITGDSGTGKSSLAAHLANATCQNGESCLYVALEESPRQIIRNMHSIGIDLQQWRDQDLLHFHAVRPSNYGLETHLAFLHKMIDTHQPGVIIMDPISAFDSEDNDRQRVRNMMIRAVDMFKQSGITSLFTNLTHGTSTDLYNGGMSSLMDSWILLRNIEQAGERTRTLYVMKSRGMNHSNQVREYVLSDHGLSLVDVMLGADDEVLTGSARAREKQRLASESARIDKEVQLRKQELERKHELMESRIAALKAEFESERQSLETLLIAETEAASAARELKNETAKRRS